jgi:hypothetical protein
MKRVLSLLVFCAWAQGADVWVRSAVTNPGARSIAPDVHSVREDDEFLYVESAGLSLHSFGALEANQYDPPAGPRTLSFRIPRHPEPADPRQAHAPLGVIGVFVTGVPIYNPIGTASYRDQNIWHLDAVAASRAGTSQLVSALQANSSRHSPVIGFALDGYPIYGPYGWDPDGNVKRMRSSYRLRAMAKRDVLPDGTLLMPGQEGPDVGSEFPLGMFAEDYEFVPGSGELDEHNARRVRTPEYPDGVYAYFLSAWPYMVGPKYAGRVSDLPRMSDCADVCLTRTPGAVTLAFHGGRRFIEKIHEKQIHLIVVSKNLAEFDHIHPEPVPGDVFSVRYTFPHGGDYTLYADYTLPGGAPAVSRFDVHVDGDSARAPVEPDTGVVFQAPAHIRAGEDVALSFRMSFRDLEPWLGAWAHIIIVSGDRENFIHAHPLEDAPPGIHTHIGPAAGPSPETISSITGFRNPGRYKLWFQFQRGGSVHTMAWTIDVEPSARAVPDETEGAIRVSAKGFEPARLTIPANRPARVAFVRTDAQNCAREVVFPELGIRKELPTGKTVQIDLPAIPAGELHFACGMGMYRGALVIQ